MSAACVYCGLNYGNRRKHRSRAGALAEYGACVPHCPFAQTITVPDVRGGLQCAPSMLGGSPYDARPCDRCRRGKRRCDGPQQPNGVCARCVRAAKNCTYSESSGREKAYPKGYVQALEARVAEVERLLREEVPEALLMQELGNMTLNTLPSVETPSSNLRALAQSDDESDPIQAVASLYETERWVNKFEHPDGHHRWRNPDLQGGFDAAQDRVVVKRPEYWRIPDHEFRGERLEERDFRPVLPPPDELASFMRRYFETSNVVRPIFHRRLFEQRLLSADAMRDRHFLAAVLLVCAIGEGQLAADSADSDNSGSAGSSKEKMPAGYQFFVQAEPLLRMPPPAEPQLLDVQLFFLAAQYIGVVLGKPTAFIPFGTALQLAYQARAHRRSSYKQYPNLLDELWKRTFWSLVVTDRAMSSLFGRPLSIKDDSFDLDLPLEVDDDRWDIATPGFPLRGASIRDLCPSSFFAWHVRLNLILGFVIQTVYSTNRSRVLMGFVGADWEQRTLSQLDALLTEWETTVPKDLGWNSDATNLEMFVQSAVLHTSFYTLIIIAHNPFMRTTAGNFARANMLTTTGLDLAASLEICTNAALQCSDILTTLIDKHPGCFALPGWSEPPFVSCMVLLVNLFGFESRLTNADIKRMTRAVRTCLNALRLISTRLRLALVWCELLDKLVSELQHDIPDSWSPTIAPDTPLTTTSASTFSSPPPATSPPTIFHPAEWQRVTYHPSMQRTFGGRTDSPQGEFNIDALPQNLREGMSTGIRWGSPKATLS